MSISKKILSLAIGALFAQVATTSGAQTRAQTPVQAQPQAPYNIPRASKPPVLQDYRVTTPANAGLEIKNLVQSSPGDGSPESYKTTAYLSYDNEHLYAVFVANANRDYLIARHVRRETNPGEDYVMLQIDSFLDKQRAFVFYSNPLGVQADSRFIEGKEEDFDFDTQWHTEGELTDAGYIVKMSIPFKSLRFPNTPQQQWGLSVARFVPELSEFTSWPHISKQKASVVAQFAPVSIAEAIPASRNLQLNPYLYSGSDKALSTQQQNGKTNSFFTQQRKTQIGLDAKYVWNNSVAFDVTVKPDFSEVESDEPQVLVDKRFETFFPEKRPFFLENAGFFQTPQNLFFSRRIVEPEAGLRVTGREGKYALGGLVIDDVALGDQHQAKIALLRGQVDLSENTNLGILASSRQINDVKNTVTSIDFRTKPHDNWIITGQLAHSQTEQKEEKSGRLAYLETIYSTRAINYTGKLTSIDKNFDASLGFLPRLNIQQSEQSGQYTWFADPSDWYYFHSLKATAIGTKNQSDDWLDKKFDLLYTLKAKHANTFTFQASKAVENLAQRDINTQGWQVGWTSKTLQQLSTTLSIGKKQALNYRYVDSAVLSGDAQSLQAKFTWKPDAHWKLDGSYNLNDLRHDSQTIYRDRLARADLSYQYNNYLGASVIVDYDDLSVNPKWSKLKSGKSLNTNIQLRYVLSPGTSVYLSYTDRQENLNLQRDIYGLSQLHTSENLDLHTGRRFFLKMNYLYQL